MHEVRQHVDAHIVDKHLLDEAGQQLDIDECMSASDKDGARYEARLEAR